VRDFNGTPQTDYGFAYFDEKDLNVLDDLSEFYERCLRYVRAKDEHTATSYDKYICISSALRTKIIDNWISSQKKYLLQNIKRFYYVSLEYNLDSPIKMHVFSNGLENEFETLSRKVNMPTDDIFTMESLLDIGNNLIGDFSGNVLETLASNKIPSVSYGLWFHMGLFKQSTNALGQVEMPYNLNSLPHPWVMERPEYSYPIFFGGRVDNEDTPKPSWTPDVIVKASSMDYPISGCCNGVVNTVRFWKAVPNVEFPSDYSLHNDYLRACNDEAETVKFLINLPTDEPSRQTSELHIKQQYFLAAATVKDIIRRHVDQQKNSIREIADKALICLADCRCGLVIVEFIRVLTYDYGIDIKEAVKMAQKIFISFLPLSENGDMLKCPLYIIESLLPSHVKIIMDMNYIILENARLLHNVSDYEAREISLIEEGAIRKVRMANLLLLFSKSVLGFSENAVEHVSNLHFKVPIKVFNIKIKPDISAISVRRWLFCINKKLTKLIISKIGDAWITDNSKLADFEKFVKDYSVQNEYENIKTKAKEKYLRFIYGESVGNLPSASKYLFISNSRKISIANSQLTILLYIACRYIRLSEEKDLLPRVYLFSGRAVPNDFYGKRLVTLLSIFSLALRDCPKLQVRFIHNDNALVKENFLAAGDIAEYISLPGTVETTEYNIYRCASNGLITLTGQNIFENKAVEKLGEGCAFGFENIDAKYDDYRIASVFEKMPILQKAFDLVDKWISDFSGNEDEENKLHTFLSNIRERDDSKNFMSFDEYYKIQEKIDSTYTNRCEWLSMALRNIARVGKCSLDNVITSLYNDNYVRRK
jgi:starch phosphorylase